MAKSYSVMCEHCEKDVSFEISEIPELDAHIDLVTANVRSEVECEFEGFVDPAEMVRDDRTLPDLAIAIRRADATEAKILLDKIAGELGSGAEEAVERGWFSAQARQAA